MDTVRRRVANQPYEHRDDSRQNFLAGVGLLDLFPCDQHVKTGGAFQCGTTGNVEKTTAIRIRVLPIALCYVEGDRCGRPVELIVYCERLWYIVEQFIDPADETDGLLVNIQFFVVKHCFHE